MTKSYLEMLVDHCALVGDKHLRAHMLDAVLPEARTYEIRERLIDYYLLRTRHRSFAPGSMTANNHRMIYAAWVAMGIRPAQPRTCSMCDRPLAGRQRRTCGSKCRKALSRLLKCDE